MILSVVDWKEVVNFDLLCRNYLAVGIVQFDYEALDCNGLA